MRNLRRKTKGGGSREWNAARERDTRAELIK